MLSIYILIFLYFLRKSVLRNAAEVEALLVFHDCNLIQNGNTKTGALRVLRMLNSNIHKINT